MLVASKHYTKLLDQRNSSNIVIHYFIFLWSLFCVNDWTKLDECSMKLACDLDKYIGYFILDNLTLPTSLARGGEISPVYIRA